MNLYFQIPSFYLLVLVFLTPFLLDFQTNSCHISTSFFVSASQNLDEMYDKKFSGQAVYLAPYPGGGSCSLDPIPPAGEGMIEGSLSEKHFFESKSCGMCVEVHPVTSGPITGKTMVIVNDLCSDCEDDDLGIAIMGSGGESQTIEWKPVKCPIEDNQVQFLFSGDKKNHLKFQVRNTPMPIRSVQVKANDDESWNDNQSEMKRTPDNFFTKEREKGFEFPLDVRVTLTNGVSRVHRLEVRGEDGDIIQGEILPPEEDNNSDNSDNNNNSSEGSNNSTEDNEDSINSASTLIQQWNVFNLAMLVSLIEIIFHVWFI